MGPDDTLSGREGRAGIATNGRPRFVLDAVAAAKPAQ